MQTDNYTLVKKAGVEVYLLRASDSACIPIDNLNGDYRNFLEWVKEGNTPQVTELQ